MFDYSISDISEDTFMVQWALAENELPTPELIALVGRLANELLTQHGSKIINVVPAYQTLLIQYDLLNVNRNALINEIDRWLQNWMHSKQKVHHTGNLHRIPVYYDAEVAADLNAVCAEKSLVIEDLITQHTKQTYSVYAVGFLPGFAYLGFVDESIAMPRHASFNDQVPAGSVGIADRQTAVYPSVSPGGWQIIGRTPSAMMVNGQSLLRTGDRVQFVSITRDEYMDLGGEILLQEGQ